MRKWERVTVGEERVPREAIERFIGRIERERCLLHGFAMADKGKLVAEEYWAPFTETTLHRMFSVGKSFVSLAIGLLQEEGKLSLDDYIYTHFPEMSGMELGDGLHPWLKSLTIRQMLMMSSCHGKTTYKIYKGNWVESFFRIEPTNLPGAVFSYDTSSTHVLSALVERLSGMKLLDYLRAKCFDKIGFSKEAFFMPDPAGVSQGGSGLNCTLRDLLGVAQLVLDGGVYQGEQLLPTDYLKEATSFQIATLQQPAYDEQLGYGYQIWQGRHGCFYFYGIGGQLAVCLPKEQFVLATVGNTLENKNGIKTIFDAFFDEIYPYLTEVEQKEFNADLSLPKVPVHERVANEFFATGKEYVFGENMLKISRLKLVQEGNCGTFCMEKEGKEFCLNFGVEEYVKESFPWTGAECYCQGDWVMKDMFFIRCFIFGPDLANLYICLRFTGDGVTVKLTKGADDMMKNFEGVASGEVSGEVE